MRRRLRTLSLLLLLIPASAAAQGGGQGVGQGVGMDILREVAPGQVRPPEAGAHDAPPRARPADEGPDLPFVSTPALRARTVAQRVQRLRATDPVGAEVAARELALHDYDPIFRGFLDGTALRASDAGDILAAFVALQWMVANDATVEPSPAALRAIRRQFVTPLADKPPLSQPAARATFAEEVKLRAVLHHAGWQAAKRTGTLPRFLAALPNDLLVPSKLRTLAMTDDGLVSRGGRPGTAPPAAARSAPTRPAPPDAEMPAAPRHAENWANVEGVYFRAAYGVGVGGMMILRFEPVVLFRDGTSYEVAMAALEDVDLAAERAAKPRRFGRWTRRGDTFTLTDDRGRADDHKLQDGRFFRAFPAAAGETIARSYRNLSGGGNTAMGGDVMVAVSNQYDFRADGTYGRGGSVGATNSGATSGVGSTVAGRRAPEGGRYALDRHTLTLTAPDGRVRRLFFAFASHRDPPEIDRDMIFVGDDAFTPSK